MVSTHSRSNASQAEKKAPRPAESTHELTQDIVQVVTEQRAREPWLCGPDLSGRWDLCWDGN